MSEKKLHVHRELHHKTCAHANQDVGSETGALPVHFTLKTYNTAQKSS